MLKVVLQYQSGRAEEKNENPQLTQQRVLAEIHSAHLPNTNAGTTWLGYQTLKCVSEPLVFSVEDGMWNLSNMTSKNQMEY
jgi:hypothetical protein